MMHLFFVFEPPRMLSVAHPISALEWHACQSSHPDWWALRINPRSRQPDTRDGPTGAQLVHYRAVPSRELNQPTRVRLGATRRRLGRPAMDDRPLAESNCSGFPLRLRLVGGQGRKNPRNTTLLLFVTVWELGRGGPKQGELVCGLGLRRASPGGDGTILDSLTCSWSAW